MYPKISMESHTHCMMQEIKIPSLIHCIPRDDEYISMTMKLPKVILTN